MGKLDVAILRYLTGEDFRVLTAVNTLRFEFVVVKSFHVT